MGDKLCRGEKDCVSTEEEGRKITFMNYNHYRVFNGPIIGQARAKVDCVPSPYDQEALGFTKGDIIDIISMNQGGRWKGRNGQKVGYFKFVNVEIMSPRRRSRSRSRNLRGIKRKPSTLSDVMRLLDMQEFLSVFVLNGYEDLTLFKDLDDEELDYLGVSDEHQRENLLAIAEELFPINTDKDDDWDD